MSSVFVRATGMPFVGVPSSSPAAGHEAGRRVIRMPLAHIATWATCVWLLVLPGRAMAANTPPTLSPVVDQATSQGTATGAITFTVGDAETPAAALTVTATSGNTTVVPDSNLLLGGSGASRWITLTPAAGQSGAATITLAVSDGTDVTTTSFALRVLPLHAAPFRVLSGSYVGNGTVGRGITGLGFTPDAVIVKSADDAVASMRTRTMPADRSKQLIDAAALQANQIQSLDPDGFTLGSAPEVNKAGVTYYWIAFQAGASLMRVGSYAGTGSTSLPIAGVGFQPGLVLVLGDAAYDAVFRTADSANAFELSGAANATSWVTSLTADGFVVGQDPRVNKAGVTYHYVAWKETPGAMVVGTYAGDGTDDRRITGVGFQPEWLITKVDGTTHAVHRPASLGDPSADTTLHFKSPKLADGANRIQQLLPDGFEVGNHGDTNKSGDTVLYMAFRKQSPPAISDVPDQTTPEDTPAVIGFVVADGETPASSLIVSASSSNQALVPDGALIIGGSGASRTLTLAPSPNAFGATTITLSVNDGFEVASLMFVLTVAPVNDAPTISAIADRTTVEDTATAPIAFTVGDLDTPAASLLVSATSSDPALLPAANIVFGGAGASRTLTLTPAPNRSGATTVTVTVSDGALTASQTFTLTVTAVNDAPTLSAITDQATSEDTATAPLPFAVDDLETPASGLVVTGHSSDTTLVPDSNLLFGGTGTARTLSVVPAANQSGSTTITVSVSDGAATRSTSFVLNVTPVNDAPTLTPIVPQTIDEDGTTGPLAFSVGDVETPAEDLLVTVQSSDAILVPVAGMLIAGSGSDRTLTLTPAPNANGTATVTLSVSDGTVTTSHAFLLTVVAQNDPPTLSPLADRATSEDTPTGPLSFTVADVETAWADLVVTATSSNTSLVPQANIVLGGTGSARTIDLLPAPDQSGTTTITVSVSDGLLTTSRVFTFSVTPANDPPTLAAIADQTVPEDTTIGPVTIAVGDVDNDPAELTVVATASNATLFPAASLTLGGAGAARTLTLVPAANQFGSATITVTVSDGAASSARSFTATVTPENDAPTIETVTEQTTAEDVPVGPIGIGVGDVETPVANLVSSASSSNPTLLPAGSLLLGGSGAARTLTITPAANQYGTATVTLSVTDGSATSSTTFELTVTPVNDPPTLGHIADQVTAEDAPTAAIPFAVGDVETPAADLVVTAASSEPSIVPDDHIAVGGFGPDRTVTITPAPNAHGTAIITLRVSDGTAITTTTFTITVTPVNDPPTISALDDQTTAEDTASTPLGFVVGDVETDAAVLVLWTSSDNPDLVPNGNIVLSGAGADRFVAATPATNRSGQARITVTVSDGVATASRSFLLTVTPENDPPTITAPADYTTPEDTPTVPLPFTIGDVETPATGLIVSATSSDASLVPDDAIVVGGPGANRHVVVTPAPDRHGTATITLGVSDGAATSSASFQLTVTPANDAPTVSDTPDQSGIEDATLGPIGFTVGDVETDPAALVVTVTSSNQSLVSAAGLVLGGSGADRRLTITPQTNQHGTTIIGITVSDGLSATTDTFVLTVTAENDPPTVSDLSDRTVLEDETLGPVAFTVDDVDTPLAELSVTAHSSSQAVIPDAGIVLTGTGASRLLWLTPAPNQNGAVTVTVTVSDGQVESRDTFVVTVTPADDVPTISNIPDQSVGAGTTVGPLTFTVGDVDVEPGTLTVTARSSNQSLVPDANIGLGGFGAERTITVTPVPGQSGSTVITITITDGVFTVTETFTIEVLLTHATVGGTISDARGPLPGITVELRGGSHLTTATDDAGRYRFEHLPVGGSYEVVPIGGTLRPGGIPFTETGHFEPPDPGYQFRPFAHAIDTLTGDATVNFLAVPMLVLSGRVQDLSEGGVEDVTMTLTGDLGATTRTDADGWYAFIVPQGGTYTVAPGRDEFWFAPEQATLANMQANATADFTATSGAFKRYFSEGATGAFFDTRFAILNPTETPAAVTVRFERSDGTLVPKNMVVPPESRVTVDPETLPGLEQAEFSTVVASDVPVIADRTMTWDSRGYGSHAETSIAKPQTIWYLAEGATIGGFNLFYLVHNPNPGQAVVEVRYLLPRPQKPIVKTYTIPANTRRTIWVNQEDPVLAAAEVSAVIDSRNGMPIIVERAMYLDAPGQVFGAGHAGAGVPAPATRWFLAEGATGPFFDCFILIANPGDADADVEAEYLLPDGTTLTRRYAVAAHSRFNIWVDLEDPRLADTAVSTTVTSTNGVPLVVERAMWWPGSPGSWREGHDSVGATQSGTKWGLAEGESGGQHRTETFVLIANTSPVDGEVQVSVILENGARLERTYPITAKSRFTIPVGAFIPEARDHRYGVMVESLGERPIQIVVERAMYSDAVDAQGRRDPWAAGTGALGTRIR